MRTTRANSGRTGLRVRYLFGERVYIHGGWKAAGPDLAQFGELEAELLEQLDGRDVIRGYQPERPLEAERFVREAQHGRGGFEGVALGPEFREEGIAKVCVLELGAPEQAAHADGLQRFLERDQIRSVPVLRIAPDWPIEQVIRSLFVRPYSPIADVRDERRVVDEPEYEFGVVRRQVANEQPVSFENGHESW